ncbi:hypothetical protein AAFF_G00133690 [Aldrovandia affinis]|uniref:Uncharacterized protein n=1 Tax=Aldrovandia affinis TaxID=143900 RepID=A0AAD7RQD9_9TELE|nr:hypothetical protein AAFF_G00133690 [Aldrovandia affinis]
MWMVAFRTDLLTYTSASEGSWITSIGQKTVGSQCRSCRHKRTTWRPRRAVRSLTERRDECPDRTAIWQNPGISSEPAGYL